MTLFKPRVGKVIFTQTTGGLSVIIPKKKLIWFRKIKFVFVYVKKKRKRKVFGIEKSDLCLLNKTKSFSLKKKYIYIYILDLFLRTRKNWFLVCIYIKKKDLFYNKKFRFVYRKNQICFSFMKK